MGHPGDCACHRFYHHMSDEYKTHVIRTTYPGETFIEIK